MDTPRKSRARATLEKACFYANEASEVADADRTTFAYHLETTIVSARAVTHHLRDEYGECDGFKSWFDSLWQNSLHCFFVDQRDIVLKEGPVKVTQRASVSLEGEVGMSGSLTVKVIRGRPWYRRKPSILWEDISRAVKLAIRRPANRWTSAWRKRQRRGKVAQRSVPAVSVGFYFEDGPQGDAPALQLLEEYLQWLEAVVRDAEGRFGKPATSHP